ncbi:hypothetical protein SAMN05443634_10318 [Chishuiella changwenlii]|uniref:YD repeat-containing protein n=1 Tax=Chishuiella changwenlii TaxID=1434701 RepID=A0A1M6UQM0_9FLAO|nr:hypothetical protein [Chishuiella changwenlii]GGF08311.1 hypothetical protein GCM10010984_26870 [Chishuiella changwenlii]SHK71488.1 hypothetical protein SAMN05443634_10318 [Chishuiella changwenlii]
MKKIYLLFLLGMVNFLEAQIKDHEKFFPKTPEVAAIGKYIDKPISLGTGSVDYQIPLETLLVDNNISIPISLKYNTDGIKVNEEASNVGLGWTLSTTSFITRNIRSQVDNYTIDLRTDIERITKGMSSKPESADYHWLNTNIEYMDSEPDEFIVNVFNTNFRFYYNYQTKKFQSVPKNDYIINGNIASNGYVIDFNIIDTHGNQYFFENTLSSTTITPSVAYITTQGSSSGGNSGLVSSWYLTKLITKDKNIVEFKYETNVYENTTNSSYQYPNVYHTSQYIYVATTNNFENGPLGRYAITGPDSNGFPTKVGSIYPISDDLVNNHKVNIVNNIYSASTNTDLILSQILVNGKKRIEFLKSTIARTDLDSYKLEKIKVFDFNEKLVKSFNLNQSYFNQENPEGNYDCSRTKVHPLFKNNFEKYLLRLRLDGITINDNADKKVNDYQLSYYEGTLPSRLSYSQDLYGYYNGKNNCSLIPTQVYKYFFNNVSREVIIGDADRSSDIEFNKIGALKKVTYPTKGSVELDYENHIVAGINDYNEDNLTPIVVKKQMTWGVEQSVGEDGNIAPNPDTYTYEFEMTQNIKGEFYTYLDTNRPDNLNAGPEMYTVSLQKIDFNGNIVQSQYLTNGNSGIQVDLTIGKYRIQATRSPSAPDYDPYLGYIGQLDYYEVVDEINKETGYTERIIGGLRIKKITNRDTDNSILLEKNYTYTDKNISTGLLMGTPIRTENSYYKEINKLNGVISFPLQSASSSKVVYSKVTEENVDVKNNQTNKTDYYFKSELGEIGDSNAAFRVSTPSFNWRINKPTQVDHFLDNQPVQSKLTEHQVKKTELRDNYGIRVRPKNEILLFHTSGGGIGPVTLYYRDFEYEYYPFYTEFPYIDKETVTESFSLNDSIVTEVNYNYDGENHLQLTKQTTKNSKGETLTTEYKYPSDLTSTYPESTKMNRLVNENRIAEPVITKQQVGSVYVSEVHNQYNEFYGILQKSAVFQKKGNGIELNRTTDRKIVYNSYDAKGNITQYTPENGLSVAIIWGYNTQYPVAKLEGIMYEDAKNKLGTYLSKLENGLLTSDEQKALRLLIPEAMITTYVYKPLVGVTQITGPNGISENYTYDSANRLEEIKNDKNEVLKTFQYNYKN